MEIDLSFVLECISLLVNRLNVRPSTRRERSASSYSLHATNSECPSEWRFCLNASNEPCSAPVLGSLCDRFPSTADWFLTDPDVYGLQICLSHLKMYFFHRFPSIHGFLLVLLPCLCFLAAFC